MTRHGWRFLGGRRALALVAVVGSVAFAQQAVPVSASLTSVIVFDGTATLPTFPCGPNCTGGTFAGHASGVAVSTNAMGDATFVQAPMASNFSYNESCPVAQPVAPPSGTANGSFTITGATATLTGNFSWTRVGLTAVIVTSSGTITYSNGNTASAILPDVSVALFVPSTPIGSCTVPRTNQTATVVGADVNPA